jgi:hypothetical protein
MVSSAELHTALDCPLLATDDEESTVFDEVNCRLVERFMSTSEEPAPHRTGLSLQPWYIR